MIVQVDMPDYIAKKFGNKIIKWEDFILEKELEDLDGKNWETIVDFGEGEKIETILQFLTKDGKKVDEKS